MWHYLERPARAKITEMSHYHCKRTRHGFIDSAEAERRCTITLIHHAPQSMARALVEDWGDKTAHEAHEVLKRPDVKVTNQKDKDVQLPKLKKLNEFAKSAVADVATTQALALLPPAPPPARTCHLTWPPALSLAAIHLPDRR